MTTALFCLLAAAGDGYTSTNEATTVQAALGDRDRPAYTARLADSGTVAGYDPLDASDLDGLRGKVGTVAAFRGTVSQVFVPGRGSAAVLNFAENYREAATAPVFRDSFSKFPGGPDAIEEALKGKTVLVVGLVTEFRGRPQIKIAHPGQVFVVE